MRKRIRRKFEKHDEGRKKGGGGEEKRKRGGKDGKKAVRGISGFPNKCSAKEEKFFGPLPK